MPDEVESICTIHSDSLVVFHGVAPVQEDGSGSKAFAVNGCNPDNDFDYDGKFGFTGAGYPKTKCKHMTARYKGLMASADDGGSGVQAARHFRTHKRPVNPRP